MEGTIIAWVPKGTSGYAKLPKDAINKRQPKSKAVAAYRVRGKDVNHQNHRFIVRSMVNGVAYFYFPTTTKLVNQSHEK
jgi:hypothetical protein